MRYASLMIALFCALPVHAKAEVPSDASADKYTDGDKPASPGMPGAFDRSEALSDSELSEERGGFVVDGVGIDLGVEMQTALNGTPVIVSTISSEGGNLSKQLWVSPSLVAATAQGAQGQGPASALVAGSQLYSANNGATLLWQSVNAGLQNGVINTAANQQILQSLSVSLSLHNYGQFSQSITAAGLGQTLGNAVAAFSLGH